MKCWNLQNGHKQGRSMQFHGFFTLECCLIYVPFPCFKHPVTQTPPFPFIDATKCAAIQKANILRIFLRNCSQNSFTFLVFAFFLLLFSSCAIHICHFLWNRATEMIERAQKKQNSMRSLTIGNGPRRNFDEIANAEALGPSARELASMDPSFLDASYFEYRERRQSLESSTFFDMYKTSALTFHGWVTWCNFFQAVSTKMFNFLLVLIFFFAIFQVSFLLLFIFWNMNMSKLLVWCYVCVEFIRQFWSATCSTRTVGSMYDSSSRRLSRSSSYTFNVPETISEFYECVSIFFSDVVGFTPLSESM